MKYLPLLFLFSCSPEPTECDPKCGKLIDTRHFRELQEIKLKYVSECTLDTINQTIKLNQSQLGTDNGVSFYVETFSVCEKYCEIK
jgi:hypothetical protein